MVQPLDFDIDDAKGFDRVPFLCGGTFDLEIERIERFQTGVDDTGKVIPGKKAGQAVAISFTVDKIITQTPTNADMPKYEEEKASENPPPPPAKEGESRRWFCNVEYEQNRQRLRHAVQAACGFEPDSKEANEAKDDDGNPVKWGAELAAAMGEDNPLAGQKVRCSVIRIITQKGKGHAMYVPSFSVVP